MYIRLQEDYADEAATQPITLNVNYDGLAILKTAVPKLMNLSRYTIVLTTFPEGNFSLTIATRTTDEKFYSTTAEVKLMSNGIQHYFDLLCEVEDAR